MKLTEFHTDEQILQELGTRLKTERIRQKMTQETFAKNCGVAKSTVERFEKGESVQLANLLKMLRTLHQLSGIELLLPVTEPSPMEYLYAKNPKEPERYREVREKTPEYGNSSSVKNTENFIWGEDK
ncbi:MAG: helix-turn-helix domain-containing protein [Spirochaetaceae bacterium]|nr:helix-turn-helix domain-containing protein [Spirochaetaceae bacterium]MBQ8212243.1 helix-turn-helix domain-containing protein [Treponema sp.]MEE1059377.1 helix-turn-helix transcriptional regulator [Treponema sp.]